MRAPVFQTCPVQTCPVLALAGRLLRALAMAWLLLAGLVLCAPGARAQSCIAAAGSVVGNASVLANNEIQLTPNALNQAGAWWSGAPIDLALNADFTFSAYLGNVDSGADGITLAFRNPASGTLGVGGGSLGYGKSGGSGGVGQSVALELDTAQSSSADPAADHLAFNSNGSVDHNLGSPISLPNLEDGAYHTVRLVWTASSQNAAIYVDGTLRASGAIDIATYTGTAKPIWGFTGATGSASNLQKVCLQSVPPQADLSITLAASSTTPTYGTTFTYTLSAISAASSNATATGVTVSDLLPAGVTFVSAAGSGTYASGTGVWSVGSLAAGASASLTITATASGAVGTSITNTAQITASSLPDPDSTVNNGATGEDDYASRTVTVGANTINCPAGSNATGSGFAASGTSAKLGQVFWLDWTCTGTSLFNAGATVNKSWSAGDGLSITGQITGITQDIRPYAAGSWSGDTLQLLHAGLNPIGLRNNTDGADPQFNLALSATLNGSATSLRYVVGDAEDSSGAASNESINASTNGTSWQTVETYGSITVTNTGSGMTIYDPAAAGGGTAVLETTAANLSLAVTMYSSGGTAAAFGFYAPYDFSDAPLTGTSYGAAQHRTLPGLRMGAAVTTEAAAYDSANAAGDSDDGVTIPTLIRNQAGTINVSVTGPGKLGAWIDRNGDGDFADAGEQLASDVTDGGAGDSDGAVNGTIALAFTPPSTMTASPTIARFRFSSSSGQASSGLAGFGEVEDYQFTVIYPNLAVAKTSTLISDPVNGTANPKAIPGAVMRYCVTITNGGNTSASSISLSDTLPVTMAYLANSMKSGSSCAGATTPEDDNAIGPDETDALGASFSGSTIAAQASSLAVGAAVALTYDVTVR